MNIANYKNGLRRENCAVHVTAVLIAAVIFVAAPPGLAVAGENVTAGQATVEPNLQESSASGPVAASLPGDLDLLLLGTVVLPDPDEALAIIQMGEQGPQELYRLGDDVAGGRLTRIQRDRVTLTFAETKVEINLIGGAGSAITEISGTPARIAAISERVQPPMGQTDDGYWVVDQDTLDQLGRSPELIKQLNSMGAGGVRVSRVRADGPFHKLGLQQGDIIVSVNGKVPGADLSLQQAIAEPMEGDAALKLEVNRQGLTDLVYYKIEP